jgi:hypothetical protein
MCRKVHGAAFRSRISVGVSEFEWFGVFDLLPVLTGQLLGLLPRSRSPIVSKFAGKSYYGVPLGAMDDDPDVRPLLHVHVASQAPWFMITDDLSQFETGP